MDVTVTLLSSLIIFSISSTGNGLSSNYYDQTCPDAESIVTNAVKKAMMKDQTVPAALLRMHFHDCFIRVCAGTGYQCSNFSYLDLRLYWLNFLPVVSQGLWCFCVDKFSGAEQCRKRRAAQRFFACILCHWQCQARTRIKVPWCSLMCWYLGFKCKRCSCAGKLFCTILWTPINVGYSWDIRHPSTT